MVQRVVPVAFFGDDYPSGETSDLRVPQAATAQQAEALNFPLDSVPVPRFTEMPQQDLAIWTPFRLVQVLVRVLAESLSPAKLRPIPISKDDHA